MASIAPLLRYEGLKRQPKSRRYLEFVFIRTVYLCESERPATEHEARNHVRSDVRVPSLTHVQRISSHRSVLHSLYSPLRAEKSGTACDLRIALQSLRYPR